MADQITPVEDLKKRLLLNILYDERKDIVPVMKEINSSHGSTALYNMMVETTNLPSLPEYVDDILLDALRVLLKDHIPDLRPHHFQEPRSMLDVHLRAYRGVPIHLAVALNRAVIVRNMIETMNVLQLCYHQPLVVRDSCHNTALCLAVRNDHLKTTETVLRLLNYQTSVMKWAKQYSMARSPEYLISRKTYESEVLKTLFEAKKFKIRPKYRPLTLHWDIFRVNQNIVKGATRCSWPLFQHAWQEPSDIHFAAAVLPGHPKWTQYGQIVDILFQLERKQTGKNPNDISVFKLGHKIYYNGTAAHFALFNYQPPSMAAQFHSGFADVVVGNSVENKAIGGEKLNVSVTGFVEMLEIIRDKYRVDMLKPNHDQKTPLDCLPPDADPQLVQALLTFK